MRVFLPAVLPSLRPLVEGGGLAPPLFGCGVTPDLRAALPEADLETLEYTALQSAARESLQLIAAESGVPRRRTVIVVEVADAEVTPDPAAGRCAVRVIGPALRRDVVAVFVDAPDAADAVAAAADAVDAADIGDEQAAAIVDQLDAHELLWFATQEIGDLLD